MGPDASPLTVKAVFLLFCLLYEVGSIDVQGSEREDVSFQCSHSYAWSNNKYFCKHPCKTDQDVLVRVQAGQKQASGRISLADLGNGVFVVNISRLQLSDSGVYSCGVDRALSDTFITVHLTVNKAPDVSTTLPPTTFSLETTAMQTTPFTTGAGTDSTLTNSVGGEHLVNTGALLFAGLGAVAVLVLFILVAYFRKCRNRSKAQPRVLISNRDLLSANKATANPQRSVVAEKARQRLPRKTEESFPYDRAPKGKPRTTASAAENGEPSHIYMNLDCSKGTARSRDQAADVYEVPDMCAVYINLH